MDYPLQLSFKLMALTPQIYVSDARGQMRMYVKQKMFKLRESITVFQDESQSQPLFHINADRVSTSTRATTSPPPTGASWAACAARAAARCGRRTTRSCAART
jgi:hypothetical protein